MAMACISIIKNTIYQPHSSPGSAKLTAETLREALAAIDILVKNRKRGDEEKRKLDEVS
jgi:hypothetical protein